MLSHTHRLLYTAFFLGVLSFATYAGSLHNRFMIDDEGVLFPKGPQVFDIADTSMTNFRPLTAVLRYGLAAVFPKDPFYYHLFNTFLFAAHVILIFLCLRRLFPGSAVALLTGILYCLHPIHASVVNYITDHEMLLLAVLLDLGLLAFLHSLGTHNTKWRILSAVLYGLALFVQEVAITFPLVLFLVLFQLKESHSFGASLRALKFHLFVAGVYLLFRFFVIKNSSNFFHYALDYIQANSISVFTYLATVLQLIGWYLAKLLLPWDILFLQRNAATLHILPGLLWAVGSIALLYIFFRGRWRGNPILFALLWLVTGFLPVFAITMVYLDFSIEPHWFFFSSIGFFLLCALFFERLLTECQSRPAKWALGLLMGLLLFGWFSLTQTYNKIWRDQKTYCLYWQALAADQRLPNFWLAKSYEMENDLQKAEYYYKSSIKGEFLDWIAYSNLGDIRMALGDRSGAQQYYLKARQLNPAVNQP